MPDATFFVTSDISANTVPNFFMTLCHIDFDILSHLFNYIIMYVTYYNVKLRTDKSSSRDDDPTYKV